MSNVLIVEPDEVNAERIRAILESVDKNFTYQLVDAPDKAIDILEGERPDVFIGDMHMPIMDGAEFFSMIEMLSPETVRIVMTDGGRIQETVSFMNRCRIYKIIIKPCRVADDLLAPINAALAYRKEQKKQVSADETAVQERKKLQQEHARKKQIWMEHLSNSKKARQTLAEMFGYNLEQGNMDLKMQERMKRWYQWMVEEYVNNILSGSGDYETVVNAVIKFCHRQDQGCLFRMRRTSDEPIEQEKMNEIAYILRLLTGICKDLLMTYDISAILETTEKAYILRVRYRIAKDADGNVSERALRVKNPELRKNICRATELGIDALGYKVITLNKGTDDILNIAIRK